MTVTQPQASDDFTYPLGLFDAVGVELEYMIVDAESLDVRPVADRLFREAAGFDTADVTPDGPEGVIGWSNELALHVAELKTLAPVAALDALDGLFHEHVRRVNDILTAMGCRLLPTGMHPWMHPDRETRLWPHENNDVYATYDRIFGCRGHGWGNLQSTHINLPFADNEEFGRLHAAIRLVLPLLPALAASSPIADGALSPWRDFRLEVYRTNSARVPLVTGSVVPEPVFSRSEYEKEVLGRLYDALRPFDREGVLRHEWANARGCIPRFDRGSIEIRVLDIQECPRADLAIVALVTEAVRALVEERWMSFAEQKLARTDVLHAVLLATVRDAETTVIRDQSLLAAFGITSDALDARDLWKELAARLLPPDSEWAPTLDAMLRRGTLSTEIVRQLGADTSPARLRDVYSRLADCLRDNVLLGAD